MISHTEFEQIKHAIETVANRELDIMEWPWGQVDRDENDGITVILFPDGFDLEPDEEDIPDPQELQN